MKDKFGNEIKIGDMVIIGIGKDIAKAEILSETDDDAFGWIFVQSSHHKIERHPNQVALYKEK